MGAHILLTGAGFTRNWGGPLVGEVFQTLIADEALSGRVKRRLWDAEDRGGYEQVLDHLQTCNTADEIEDLRALEASIKAMFVALRYQMAAKDINLNNQDIDTSLTKFLGRFDALFTLNQDTFLETHYEPFLGGRWDGFVLPGTQVLGEDGLCPSASFEAAQRRMQPYFKLHGSMHFYRAADSIASPVMIVGGRKKQAIQKEPLLTWYYENFVQYLSQPSAKLMIIGYGFNDPHINEAIENAAQQGLKIFVVDPLGARVLDKRDPRSQIPQPKSRQQETIESAVAGASKRSLAEIFGNDTVEWHNVMKFFG